MKQKLPLGRQGLLDMSAITWAGLLAGEDKEFGCKVPAPDGKLDANGKPKLVQVNGWQHGYWNAMESVLAFMRQYQIVPRDLILVLDGQDSKRLRRSIFPGYKAGSDHAPEQKVEFDKALQAVKEQLLAVGASCCQQQYREADDVIGYLAQNLQVPVAIRTVDNDLAVLQGPNVTTFIGTSGNSNENYNRYGVWPARYITLYKALVGDTSDTYPGVKGFGDKSFQRLYAQYEEAGLDALIGLIERHELDRLAEDVAEAPYLKPILEDPEGAYTCWQLARLMPEKVNTGRCPLQWEVGMVKPYRKDWTDERLAAWAGHMTLIHAGNYDAAYRAAKARVAETPWVALDIETDTPPESKEWLAEKNRAKGEEDDGKGVDVFGSELVSLGLTFGDNGQFTVYLTHGHAEADSLKNVSNAQVRQFVELFASDARPTVIQNLAFELSVLHREWAEAWANNGWHGFIPNTLDTKIEASYVNENLPKGLKFLSKHYLGYTQQTYEEVTQGRGMRELTAREAFGYGADDPLCTAALHQHFSRIMLLEGTWDAYREVEILPAYLSAHAYNAGQRWSLQRLLELEKTDLETRERCWATLRDFLISKGWEGTVCPVYGPAPLTVAQIKEAFLIVTGDELKTQVRTPAKLVSLVEATGFEDLSSAISFALSGDFGLLNACVKARFTGEPALNFDSPKQVQRLLYETLGLPIRLRNKPTTDMRKAVPALKQNVREAKAAVAAARGYADAGRRGADEDLAKNLQALKDAEAKLDVALCGNPKTDDLAVLYALKFDAPSMPELAEVLRAYQVIRTTDTKSKMFYRPYRYVRHWKDGLVRPQYNQSATVTRRHTCTDPNQQQQPKHEKHGEVPLIRSVVAPHHDDAVVISLDFSGQELRVIADYSRDQNMLDCFIGEHKKDMHSLTAAGIVARKSPQALWELMHPGEPAEGTLYEELKTKWSKMTYELFTEIRHDKSAPDNKLMDKFMRPLGKKCNFTTEYGAQAPKLAETLLVDVEEAQAYIDAKHAAFPRSEAWKLEVIAEAQAQGYVTTKLGARRHLAEALFGNDGYARSQAERQAVNFKVQSSSAEMTKLAMGRCWAAGLLWKYDCRFYGPIHDELVWSVHRKDAVDFIKELNALMTEPYADMVVPIVASASLGANFKDQIECGDYYDAAAIQQALDSLFGIAMKGAA